MINFLIEIIQLSGDIKVVAEIKKLIDLNKMNFTNELNNLHDIANNIKKFNKSCEIQIDLCEFYGYEYQPSIIYTAYVPNFRKEIANFILASYYTLNKKYG